MKTLLVGCEKGGVGKSLTVSQFAAFCAYELNLRVLTIDLDQQLNLTKWMRRHQCLKNTSCDETSFNSLDVLVGDLNKISTLPSGTPGHIISIPALDKNMDSGIPDLANSMNECLTLLTVSNQTEETREKYINNFKKFIQEQNNKFDICIIDTNCSPDTRYDMALVACTHILAPIEVKSECIEGIGALLNKLNREIHLRKLPHIKKGLLGILPNKINGSKLNNENVDILLSKFGKLLINIRQYDFDLTSDNCLQFDERGNVLIKENNSVFAKIKESRNIENIQAQGASIFQSKEAERFINEFRLVFLELVRRMELTHENISLNNEEISLLRDLKDQFGDNFKCVIYRFWIKNTPAGLSGFSPDKQILLRGLKKKLTYKELFNFNI